MSIAPVANVGGSSGSNNTRVSGAIDTTGVTLIVVTWAGITSTGATVTDSKGNTWTQITNVNNQIGSNVKSSIWYTIPTSVGSGHTFTITTTFNSFPDIFVSAWSGTKLTAVSDTRNDNVVNSTSGQPGSITPAENDELIFGFLCGFDGGSSGPTGLSVNSGLTLLGTAGSFGGQQAYLIQTTLAAINPTWNWTGSMTCNIHNACFKSDSPSSSSTFPALRMNA